MRKWLTEKDPKGTIVIVHGALEYHGRYKWLVEKFNEVGYHVVMGDLPGQGLSTRRRGHIYSFDEYMDEIELWIKEAYLLEPPVFVLGHSMGALAVIRTLQEKKELLLNGIILSSPCLGLARYPNKAVEFISRGLNVVKPTMLFNADITLSKVTRNREVQEVGKKDTLYVKKVSVRWYRELLEAIKLAQLKTNELPKHVPLLVMQAGEDLIVNKEDTVQWFNLFKGKNKTYVEWEGLYHEIFNEPEREEVFRYAFSFVEMHLKGN
ncbi:MULTISPECIES: alpha/beta hydrolase [Bacillus]|uniref:alpha/beta hydrolase n=1 Tax=Bacillus TaxID=1386 RepID=UPI000BB83E8E|nr:MULTISPECIES: alpha/beta hydrolase [Bacillus]